LEKTEKQTEHSVAKTDSEIFAKWNKTHENGWMLVFEKVVDFLRICCENVS
jgi:hypothetical protein